MAVKAFVFDAYGTLFDFHAAVTEAGQTLGPQAAEISALWRIKQLEYSWVTTLMDGPMVDFWTLTERGLDFALSRFQVDDEALRERLLDAYRRLAPYPDARPLLESLKRQGTTTAILTNGTAGMVGRAIDAAGFGPLLDHVVTVGPVGRYKPVDAVYRHGLNALGLASPKDVVFVSSNRWDVAGASRFGHRAVWVNRTGAPDEYPGDDPVAVVGDLAGLAGSALL